MTANHTNTEIRIARTVPEVEGLREAWTGWPGHRDSDIDFYLMINQAHPEILRPHVIALYRDGKPDAILIGRLDKKGHRNARYMPLRARHQKKAIDGVVLDAARREDARDAPLLQGNARLF